MIDFAHRLLVDKSRGKNVVYKLDSKRGVE